MINWKVRFKNPVFWGEILMSVLLPILAYGGLTLQDMNSWSALFDLLKGALANPYVLGLVAVSVWNAINDPTTKGVVDSERALGYVEPYNDEAEGEK